MTEEELTALWALYGQAAAANAANDVAAEAALMRQLAQAVPALLTALDRSRAKNAGLRAENADLQARLDGIAAFFKKKAEAAGYEWPSLRRKQP